MLRFFCYCFLFFELTIENAVLARIIATVTKQLYDEIGRELNAVLARIGNSTHELQLVYGHSNQERKNLMDENLELGEGK